MTRALFVTGQHFATHPRKVDLHFMAEALIKAGVAVDFLSLRLSLLSRLASDERWAFARTRPSNRWTQVSPLFREFIWVSALHPLATGRPWFDRITTPAARFYGRQLPLPVKSELGLYSHIVVESGVSILAIPEIRRLAPKATLIYHAADRLSTIGAHPAAKAVLEEQIGSVDLVHVMAEAIRRDIPPGANIIYLPHGISKPTFDEATVNPFHGPRNAVSVGDMLFDPDAVSTMAAAFPNWTFHLFGRRASLTDSFPNVVTHGEKPFDEIASFIKFADVGIAPYRPAPDADYLSQSSMKMIQYSYCKLPIVAPDFAAAGRAHVLSYQPGHSASISGAFGAATTFDRGTIDAGGIMTWEEKTAYLFDVDNSGSRTQEHTLRTAFGATQAASS